MVIRGRLWRLSNPFLDPADHERLVKAINDTNGILDRIEAARGQLSVLGDEMRGQQTILRERISWLTREMDALKLTLQTLAPKGVSP